MDAETKATIEHALQRLDEAFKRKWDEDPHFQETLKGKDRTIVIDLGITHYILEVKDGYLSDIREMTEAPHDPEVHVRVKPKHFVAIYEKRLNPLKAWLTRKVKVKAPASDITMVRAMLGM